MNLHVIRSCSIALLLAVAATGPAFAKKGHKDAYYRYAAHSIQPIEARVTRLLPNPYGEVDALLLDNGSLVRFPGHMSEALTAVVKRGDRVAIIGRPERNAVDVRAFSIRNIASGREVIETPRMGWKQPKEIRYAGLAPMTVRGTIERHLLGKHGEIKDVILKDGTVVRLPKHAVYGRIGLLQIGAEITVSGRGSRTESGRSLYAEALAGGNAQPQPFWPR